MAGIPMIRVVAAAAGLATTTAGWAQETTSPRPELEKMERALAAAAGRVSRPAAVPVLGAAEICRGYRLQGVGAWFVVAPRTLPEKAATRARQEADLAKANEEMARAISDLERAAQSASSEYERQALRRQIDGLTHPRRALENRPYAAAERERELRAWQERAEAMHRAAEAARQDAKRAIAMLEKMHDTRIEVEGQTAPPPQGSRASEQETSAPPLSGRAMPPMFPFQVWTGSDSVEETRTPEAVLKDVRDAITQAIVEHGPSLTLPANEMIAVAVDFFRPAPLACSKPPARTLVVRAPRRVLAALASGSLSLEEARKQLETLEY